MAGREEVTDPDNTRRVWPVTEREPLLARPPWLEVIRERLALPGGGVADFFRVEMPAFAQVLPVTPEGKLVLIEGYRPGYRQWSWGVPGGMIEAGEAAEQAATRELLEETGYRVDKLHPVGVYGIDGNRGCGRMHLFVGLGARRVAEPKLDNTEEMRVRLVEIAEARRALLAGEFKGLPEMSSVAMGLMALGSIDSGL